jgi:transcriptional antiterminator RfaH
MNWYALYVNARSEKKVFAKLLELGIDAFLPLKKEKKQWSDRKKMVISPLLNGYVFVRISSLQRDLVFQASGVIQYVRFNGKDAEIKENEIAVLRDIEEKGYHVEAHPLEKLSAGESALILEGPFKGMSGKIEWFDGKELYSLSLESIGYTLRVQIGADLLSKKNT